MSVNPVTPEQRKKNRGAFVMTPPRYGNRSEASSSPPWLYNYNAESTVTDHVAVEATPTSQKEQGARKDSVQTSSPEMTQPGAQQKIDQAHSSQIDSLPIPATLTQNPNNISTSLVQTSATEMTQPESATSTEEFHATEHQMTHDRNIGTYTIEIVTTGTYTTTPHVTEPHTTELQSTGPHTIQHQTSQPLTSERTTAPNPSTIMQDVTNLSNTPVKPSNGSVFSTNPTTESKRIRSLYELGTDLTAGGMEDWTNVDVQNVDRYGFISDPGHPQVRPTSSTSSMNRKSLRMSMLRSSQAKRRHIMSQAGNMLDPQLSTAAGQLTTQPTATDPTRQNRDMNRNEKWLKMAIPANSLRTDLGVGAGTNFTFNTTDPKLISRTWKGIPDRFRATAWHAFLTTSADRRAFAGHTEPSDASLIARYHDLQALDCLDDAQIDLDVHRTIGQHIMFRTKYHGGQRLLFRVLRALALYFPNVGYVQGMGAIVSTLLCYYDEELAFVMAVRMWLLRGVAYLYHPGFAGLTSALNDLESQWIGVGDEKNLLKEHLVGLGAAAAIWGTKWYLTLFCHVLPFPTLLRVWDVFILLEGRSGGGRSGSGSDPDLDVLHAVAAALLLGMSGGLLAADFEGVMEGLTRVVGVGEGEGEDVLMGVVEALMKMKGV